MDTIREVADGGHLLDEGDFVGMYRDGGWNTYRIYSVDDAVSTWAEEGIGDLWVPSTYYHFEAVGKDLPNFALAAHSVFQLIVDGHIKLLKAHA